MYEAAEAAKAARILALEEQGHPRISAILIADTEASAATAKASAATAEASAATAAASAASAATAAAAREEDLRREIAKLRCELVTQIMMERFWSSSSKRTCRMEAIHSFDSRRYSF
jgi:hypothetical protein